MAAGTGLPPQLVKFWVAGAGAALVRWGEPGDFDRCRREINQAIVKGGSPPLSDHVISGLCSTLHVLATSARPGHAASEQRG